MIYELSLTGSSFYENFPKPLDYTVTGYFTVGSCQKQWSAATDDLGHRLYAEATREGRTSSGS